MRNWITTLIFAAGLLGVATQLSARPGFGGAPMDPLDRIERMAEHLDLTAEQEQQITDLVKAAQIDNAVDRERLHQIRNDLRALSESFDDVAAQTLADELGQISGRLAYSLVSTMAAARAVFTAEQLQQIEEFRARHEEFREQFGSRHRGMFHGD
ncbi:MAG: Spy/CpxP family protein refolding chaperone [Gammaproteobacteria bacterium]|nr:Spy/CpxP family protein refolding chaperone [Gammaproteobacteria bacterium]